MISQGCNAFPYNVMQTYQGPDRLLSSKSHVQTACESHDLNMDFCGFKQLHVTNSYAITKDYLLIAPLNFCCNCSNKLSHMFWLKYDESNSKRIVILSNMSKSRYDQEIPQSHTLDQSTALLERDTEHDKTSGRQLK